MQELFDRRSRLEQEFMERYLASVENYQVGVSVTFGYFRLLSVVSVTFGYFQLLWA
jgi:hypothetical protein